MSSYPRYALYYVPDERSDLYRFGAQVIGFDAFTGREIAFPPNLLQEHADWSDLTGDARKYGFHATLKAPFALQSEATEAGLLAAVEQFAAQARAIPVIAPVVRALGGFVGIVPSEPNAALNDLARDCVVAFDPFRAPLSSQDRARRQPDALTPRQRDHLDRWGYPYVMEDFRFHMTLTGALPPERGDGVAEKLRRDFETLNLATLPIDRIALFKQQDGQSRFEVKTAFELTPASH